jgi:hypothetical protein
MKGQNRKEERQKVNAEKKKRCRKERAEETKEK